MTTYEEEIGAYTAQIGRLNDLSELDLIVKYRKHIEDLYMIYHPDGDELGYYRVKTEIARARRDEILDCNWDLRTGRRYS